MINPAHAVRKFQRLVERSWNFHRLGHEGNPITESVTHSVRAALKQVLTHEEKSWINRIEYLRTEMNASTRQMTRIDYGAGSPDSNRTREEARAGVEISETLGHAGAVRPV